MDEIPAGVSVNEAVNLAKKYEDAEMAAYINGVLGSNRAAGIMGCLAFDTSNYTTSVAYYEWRAGRQLCKIAGCGARTVGTSAVGRAVCPCKAPAGIGAGADAQGMDLTITSVAASTRPRAVDGSYMPCFLAGQSQGQAMASVLKGPFFAVSHQQGHLAAALWSAGRMELMQRPFLAWHLSGGTTELLLVEPDERALHAVAIGGTKEPSQPDR